MGNWKTKEITAPSNMTTTSQLKAWLETADLIPSCNYGFIISAENKTVWDSDEFIFAPLMYGRATVWGSNTNGWYARVRGTTQNNQYYQQRGFQNEETCKVYQGDKFTIFYQ